MHLPEEWFFLKPTILFAIEVGMKKILYFLVLLFNTTLATAQNTCYVPDQSVAIFFGNGIDTSEESAERSLNRLRDEIGATYNGRKVRYDLTYNKTSGKYEDLGQSFAQFVIQFDSQIMAWVNGMGAAPAWFSAWYQDVLLSLTTVVASELPEHVEKYSNALAFGQKVVVVAHSQGNFYVNEAKKLMQQKLSADTMNSFVIFGAAVPSNNVGGAFGSYYTNHRDIIYQVVPTSLPQNWLLHRAAGELETTLDWIVAHSFVDTYMSDDFDMKSSVVAGIKAQMNAAPQPVADCTTYRPQILSMVTGAYDQSCGNEPPNILTISPMGVTWPGGRVNDMTGPDSRVSLARDDSRTSLVEGATWDANGVLQPGCGEGRRPPSLGKIEITKTMMALIQPPYQLFPVNSCWVREAGVARPVRAATPVVIAGTTVYVGNSSWDFGDKIAGETVVATNGNETMPHDYDPGFNLFGGRPDGTITLVQYRRNKGLRNVAVLDPSRPIEDQIILSCNFR